MGVSSASMPVTGEWKKLQQANWICEYMMTINAYTCQYKQWHSQCLVNKSNSQIIWCKLQSQIYGYTFTFTMNVKNFLHITIYNSIGDKKTIFIFFSFFHAIHRNRQRIIICFRQAPKSSVRVRDDLPRLAVQNHLTAILHDSESMASMTSSFTWISVYYGHFNFGEVSNALLALIPKACDYNRSKKLSL